MKKITKVLAALSCLIAGLVTSATAGSQTFQTHETYNGEGGPYYEYFWIGTPSNTVANITAEIFYHPDVGGIATGTATGSSGSLYVYAHAAGGESAWDTGSAAIGCGTIDVEHMVYGGTGITGRITTVLTW